MSKAVIDLEQFLSINGISQELHAWLLPSSLIALAHTKKNIQSVYMQFMLPVVEFRGCSALAGYFGSQNWEVSINGIRHGRSIQLNDNNVIMKETYYSDGRKNGIEKHWFEDRYIEDSYANDKRHGLHREWRFNKLYHQAEFQNNKLHNVETFWSKYGKIVLRIHHVNGLKHGKYEEWQIDGEKVSEIDYENGLIHGKYLSWIGDKIRSEVDYVHGKKHGKEKYWFWPPVLPNSSPQLESITSYQFGKKNGFDISFSIHGEITQMDYYADDVLFDHHIRFIPGVSDSMLKIYHSFHDRKKNVLK